MYAAARRMVFSASAAVLGGGAGAGGGGGGGGTGNGGKLGPSPPPPQAVRARGDSVERTKFLRFMGCLLGP
ncbi:hypothetical protein M2165_003161 [Variovorax sp. TBS-050B]|nr:hypothetical protein [Variovorax sp. TBS-050B]